MKAIEQLDTELRGEITLPRDRYLELAQQTANQVKGVAVLDVLPRGVVIGVKKWSKTVAAFEVVTLKAEDDQAADGLKILVHWTEEMVSRSLNSDSATAGIFKAYVTGVPGFTAYRAYLEQFKRAVLAADPTATVTIQRGEHS